MAYRASLYPFRFRRLNSSSVVAVSESGDHEFLETEELRSLVQARETLSLDRIAELKSKFFVGDPSASGIMRLLASRIATRQEAVLAGPALHILVPTLRCTHSCRYCQVNRSLEAEGFTISLEDLDAACDTIFKSPSPTLTVEFQGGEPLLQFDLVRRAIERIVAKNESHRRRIRFVVCSTLHQLDPDMCAFFKAHEVCLSTSIDGPAVLHNHNRLTPTGDAFERTVAGVEMARAWISPGSVSALMTTTRDSLRCPEDIVDTYVSLGFNEIFIRPLNHYGLARRNERLLDYSATDFCAFYERVFQRVLYWNLQGVPLREVAASIALNKILSPFDAGYVDLQSPTGAGLAVLVYNYDGYVYPSDEARMLAGSGDTSLRLGRIGESLKALLESDVERDLIASSFSRVVPGCRDCAYNTYCGPDPVGAYARWGSFSVLPALTEHCQRQLWLFDFLFKRLKDADPWFEDLAYRWAQPNPLQMESLDA